MRGAKNFKKVKIKKAKFKKLLTIRYICIIITFVKDCDEESRYEVLPSESGTVGADAKERVENHFRVASPNQVRDDVFPTSQGAYCWICQVVILPDLGVSCSTRNRIFLFLLGMLLYKGDLL